LTHLLDDGMSDSDCVGISLLQSSVGARRTRHLLSIPLPANKVSSLCQTVSITTYHTKRTVSHKTATPILWFLVSAAV